MKEYTVPATNTYTSHGSSEGSQVKFFYAGKWFKQNLTGYEGKAEHLASCVLACSNIDDFVWYDECIINGRKGCVSDSFYARMSALCHSTGCIKPIPENAFRIK